jgi:hypothetical protein
MLHALVGGEAVKGSAHPLAAEYGPLTAAQCHAVLQGGGTPDDNGHVAATCGAFQELLIEVHPCCIVFGETRFASAHTWPCCRVCKMPRLLPLL